jgi:hypothetical protein
MEHDFSKIGKVFDEYTSHFDLGLEKALYKYKHSYRVVSYSKELEEALKLNEHDRYIAEIVAMYHDIARFEQVTKYDTFWDVVSFDHGDRGAEILQEEKMLDNFDLTNDEKDIVIKAVRNHNKFKIEDGLTDRELLFAKIVRDADKIDIIEMQFKKPAPEKCDIEPDILDNVSHDKQYERSKKTIEYNYATRICMMLTFLYDINFKKSFEILIDRGIINEKFEALKLSVNKQEEYETIKNSVERFIKEKMDSFNE